jgi:hypothetical protein
VFGVWGQFLGSLSFSFCVWLGVGVRVDYICYVFFFFFLGGGGSLIELVSIVLITLEELLSEHCLSHDSSHKCHLLYATN